MKKYIILAAVCWFAVISLVGVILTVYDKRIAGSGKRRVPEATLMAVGLLGAAGPMYLTMKKIRHKTKHKKFMLGLPAEVLLHILIIAATVYYCRDGLFLALLSCFLGIFRRFRYDERDCFSDIYAVIVLLESNCHSDCSVAVRAVVSAAEILV